jgi:hypothetical protein
VKLEVKNRAIVIVPENDQDRAFIEDSLKLTKNGAAMNATRVEDVALGFTTPDSFVVKLEART